MHAYRSQTFDGDRSIQEVTVSKKPTGALGPLRVTTGGNTAWERIDFGTDKETIEKKYFDLWRKGMESQFGDRVTGVQNEESNFDFTVGFNGGKAYLELMEIVLPNPGGGRRTQLSEVGSIRAR